MKIRSIYFAFAALFLLAGVFGKAQAQTVSDYKISAPFNYKNLTIFLIHGKDQTNKKNILTLEEAMENKEFVVYETSDVNELAVENLSKTNDVFIQSGDIVKGGQQDRLLAVSIIIPANSGKVLIAAFCVESGRWAKRGGEDKGQFSSSNERIVSRDLKIAANISRSQSEVWSEVSNVQQKLSENVGGSVNSTKSETSLQLSLEDKKVRENIDRYISNLGKIIEGKKDVIGYAFAINGKINSADVYVSNSLFKKLWLKMLKASATEAVANLNEKTKTEKVNAADVKTFLSDSEKGKSREETVSKRTKVITREDETNIVFEAMDEKAKLIVHKSYVKKQ
ncbi:MAG: ARPP-1 family domain-containing protein [Pyrinomonadaceae bacterium]